MNATQAPRKYRTREESARLLAEIRRRIMLGYSIKEIAYVTRTELSTLRKCAIAAGIRTMQVTEDEQRRIIYARNAINFSGYQKP